MGGMDTKGRFHVHWGPPETYGERREESALRRSGRDRAGSRLRALRAARHRGPSTTILEAHDHDPKHLLPILEATQAAFGFLPVAALKRISERTGTWYAQIYGTASYYGHLRFEPPDREGAGRRGGRPPADRCRLPGGARRVTRRRVRRRRMTDTRDRPPRAPTTAADGPAA